MTLHGSGTSEPCGPTLLKKNQKYLIYGEFLLIILQNMISFYIFILLVFRLVDRDGYEE